MEIFKKKPYRTIDAGEFHFNFYYKEGVIKDTYLTITTDSGIFEMKIGGNTFAYGYLLAALEQGMVEQLHGYAVMVYLTSLQLPTEERFCEDIQKAIMSWQKRKMKEGEKAAKEVTETQEIADDAFMREAIERGSAKTRQQRRKMERESRKEAKKVVKDTFSKK